MRTMLASLLLSYGQVVSDFKLVQMLWGEEPPSTTQAQLHTYASRLRLLLGPEVRIARQPPGYRLTIAAEGPDVDLTEFERLASEGHLALAAGQMRAATGLLGAALTLWQGQPLAGVTEHLAAAEQPRLEEARLSALEDRIDADLALGSHDRLITELTSLVAAHPLRDRLRAQLMLGLYRSGRTPDALAAYQAFRRLLADELGLDPSAHLQHLHQSILADDPALMSPAARRQAAPLVRTPVLAPETSDFTARAAETARVYAVLTASAQRDRVPDVCAITGMCGTGKTTLALHVARKLREHFIGGQLRADLGGSTGQRSDPAAILSRLLKAFGVEEDALPASTEDLMALYRHNLAGTRTLILLDDAADECQVRPLIPGVPGCAVLITSRSHLAALEGAQRIRLDVFTPGQSMELLTKIVGADRVATEEPAARRIVELCENHPLAVRISAARLAARPHWKLDRLVQRLAQEHRLLDELRLADLDMRTELASSYRAMGPDARKALMALSGTRSVAFSADEAAVRLNLPPTDAQDLVDEIIGAHLIKIVSTDPDHYQISNLINAFVAQEMAKPDLQDSYRVPLQARGEGVGLIEGKPNIP
jgi:DNA-binding SARP family transcriptional activator